MEIEVTAYAKINLTLDVVSRRPDGYHNIESVMQKVGIHDTIRLRSIPSGIRFGSINASPKGKDNLAYRAAELLERNYRPRQGVEMDLIKSIPMAAGLGGGSADAAAVLTGLSKLWGLEIEPEEMLQLGLHIGSDVPFCLQGPTALVRGKGEIVLPQEPMSPFWVVLACPMGEISTAWAYSMLDLGLPDSGTASGRCLEAIAAGDLPGLGESLGNIFQPVAGKKVPSILALSERMMEQGALGACMSGSGPTVFGIFPSQSKAESASESLGRLVPLRFLGVTRSLYRGGQE